MSRTRYFMDPECMFEFAKIPADVPKRFAEPLYPVLWKYFCEYCATSRAAQESKAAYAAAAEAIRSSRPSHFCSVADMREAGFTEFGYPMVPQEIVASELKKIVDREPPC